MGWIADPNVYPVYQWPNDGVHARGDSDGYRRQFCYSYGFFLLILARLASWTVLAWRQGLVSFPQKKQHQKIKETTIYIYIYIYI